MGCVPSTNAGHTAGVRTSSSDNKPQQHVELTTKNAPKVVSAPAPVHSIHSKEAEISSLEEVAPVEELSAPKHVDTDASAVTQIETIVEFKLEPVPSKEDTEVQPQIPPVTVADHEQLMLDFETFALFPDVQSVMTDGSVDKELLRELFSIVDKDADGYVNDQEREDLLELISLSYGAKSKPVTPVNCDTANHTSPSSVVTTASNDGDHHTVALPPVPLINVPDASFAPAEEIVSSSSVTTPVEVAADDSAAAQAASDSPVNTEASTSTKSTTGTSGKRKPKVIKFINPELLLQEVAKPVETEGRSHDSMEVNTPATVVEAPDTTSTLHAMREPPPQKKGFMLTRRESFNHRDSTEQGQSRFFNLDAGLLSYMDSTSRKPPFSMTHREIALKGVEVRANKNTIELIPFAANTGNTEQDEEVDSAREIVVLELKNEKECEVWMEAIREHMKFSLGVQ